MKSKQSRIAKAILKKTLKDEGYVVQDFFVGVTDDPQKSLFSEHKVDKEDGVYTYEKADSAKEAEKAFKELYNLDMNGLPVRMKKNGKYVYCYHINGETIECPKNVGNL